MNFHVIFLFLAFSSVIHAQYPESWDKDEGYELQDSGVLKFKKKLFYYKLGSMYAGSSHYGFAIRLSWNKESNLAYDAELSGVMSDSPKGKLSLNGNRLTLKTQFVQDENMKTGEIKMGDVFYCWIFKEKTEEFIEQDHCPQPLQRKRKKLPSSH